MKPVSRRHMLAGAAGLATGAAFPARSATLTSHPDFKVLATDLVFPEGPVPLDNGDVVLVEIGRGTLSRVKAGGGVEVVADLGGRPNGAAIGPDGACYVANDGGSPSPKRTAGCNIPACRTAIGTDRSSASI